MIAHMTLRSITNNVITNFLIIVHMTYNTNITNISNTRNIMDIMNITNIT